jgi:hypothetical protein
MWLVLLPGLTPVLPREKQLSWAHRAISCGQPLPAGGTLGILQLLLSFPAPSHFVLSLSPVSVLGSSASLFECLPVAPLILLWRP